MDFWINTIVKKEPQLWDNSWTDKLNPPADPADVSFRTSEKQAVEFEVPCPEIVNGYLEASRGLIVRFLTEQNDDLLSSIRVQNPGSGLMPLSTLFQQLLWEINQHGGHIAYLRGMHRGNEGQTYTGGVISR